MAVETKFDDDTAELDKLVDTKSEAPSEEEPQDYVPHDEVIKDEDEEVKSEEPEPEVVEPEEPIDTNVRGVDLKLVREKYPDFAKTNEFKELRNAYYRESQYTELFPTLDDAREAAENNATFEALNQSLVGSGDPTTMLEAVKNANPNSFRKMAVNFLDTLNKVDNASYIAAVDPLVRRMAKQIYGSGRKALSRDSESNEGKALVATARNIMQYFFDDAEKINEDVPQNQPEPEISQREQELQQREAAIIGEKFQSAYRVAETSLNRNLEMQITAGLDPDGRLSEFTKDALVEKIRAEVEKQVSADQNHLKRMVSLWKRAEQTGYNRESLSRIVSAYLERARPIIPQVRSKFRTKAIGNSNGQATEDNRERGPKLITRGASGKPVERRPVGKVSDTRKIDYSKTTDDDIFEGRIKLKG